MPKRKQQKSSNDAFKKRSAASKKGWETRRKKKAQTDALKKSLASGKKDAYAQTQKSRDKAKASGKPSKRPKQLPKAGKSLTTKHTNLTTPKSRSVKTRPVVTQKKSKYMGKAKVVSDSKPKKSILKRLGKGGLLGAAAMYAFDKGSEHGAALARRTKSKTKPKASTATSRKPKVVVNNLRKKAKAAPKKTTNTRVGPSKRSVNTSRPPAKKKTKAPVVRAKPVYERKSRYKKSKVGKESALYGTEYSDLQTTSYTRRKRKKKKS